MRHRPGGMDLRSGHLSITGAMGPSTSWDSWPRPVARAAVGMQECTQIDKNGLSTLVWGIRVHYCDAIRQGSDPHKPPKSLITF